MPSDLAAAGTTLDSAARRAPEQVSVAAVKPGYLFHPAVDFLCLGGLSLLVLPLCLLLPDSAQPDVLYATWVIAHVINHPHFAHSYQIFYSGFGEKAFGASYAPLLRARYIFAGIVVPVILVGLFGYAILSADPVALGFGVNAMFFFVGWHYVKQGYGMLIVESVLKRQYFNAAQKKALVAHAYAVWIFTWFAANTLVAEHNYWGLKYYTFDVPDPLLHIALALTLMTGIAVIWVLARKWAAKRTLPYSGVVAYAVTLYLWQIFRLDPKFVVIVPAMHSLQYLIVVWRFQLNRERARAPQGDTSHIDSARRFVPSAVVMRFARFLVLGMVLGFVGFWGAPLILDEFVTYDEAAFGNYMFLFCFTIFINVHHYFLDNVMWRGENPDTRQFLFAHRS